MYATAMWIALLTVSVALEVISWAAPRRISSLERTGARIAIRVSGRALLWALWIFVGLHLFARYTLPR